MIAMFLRPEVSELDIKIRKLMFSHTPPETGGIVEHVQCFRRMLTRAPPEDSC